MSGAAYIGGVEISGALRASVLFLTAVFATSCEPQDAAPAPRPVDPFATPRDGRENVPEQIRIAYGADPRTSMSVAWCADSRPTAAAVREPRVVVRPSGRADVRPRAVPGTRRRYAQETFEPWDALVDELAPDTAYDYRVEGACGESAWATFRTAPDDRRPFTFTAFGDHGTGPAARAHVATLIAEKPAFHLLLGDVSYANGDQRVWDVYGRLIAPFARETPLMVAIGNHEYEKYEGVAIGPVAFLARFALPGDERDYVFDYAGVRFVVVDSVRAQERGALLRLEMTLAEARAANVRRLVVAQHYPHFGSCLLRGYNVPLIQLQGPLFERYGVDLVLNGHDHFYERTYPIRGGKVVSNHASLYATGEGVVHVTAGGGGAGLYAFQPGPKPDTTCVRLLSHGYLRIRVGADDAMDVEAIGLDGATIDRFRLAPPASGR